jgi:hypothetical protein
MPLRREEVGGGPIPSVLRLPHAAHCRPCFSYRRSSALTPEAESDDTEAYSTKRFPLVTSGDALKFIVSLRSAATVLRTAIAATRRVEILQTLAVAERWGGRGG